MKSTGEVMGTGRTFGEAYAKAQLASGVVLPRRGLAFISVRDRDKPGAVELGKMLIERGFEIVATGGTAKALADGGVQCQRVNKVREGRPHVVDMIKNRELSLIVNTTEGKQAIRESHSIRGEAVHYKVTYYTTLAAAKATCDALDHLDNVIVNRLQDLHAEACGLSKVPLTARGAAQLREELRRLKNEERPKVTAAIATARAHGDLKENAEYHAAKEQQGLMEARIRDIEAKLGNAQIIDVTALNADGKVVFGATVHLVDADDGSEGALPDRRRGRSRHQRRAAVDQLADRARADRQARGRRGRGRRAERPPRVRDHGRRVRVEAPRAVDAAPHRVPAIVGVSARSATSTSSKPTAKGWRSRAVFKLEQIQAKERLLKPRHGLRGSRRGPGGWSQLAARARGPERARHRGRPAGDGRQFPGVSFLARRLHGRPRRSRRCAELFGGRAASIL